jgi:hypothetical protein
MTKKPTFTPKAQSPVTGLDMAVKAYKEQTKAEDEFTTAEFAEAAGLQTDRASDILASWLSEGRVQRRIVRRKAFWSYIR